MIKLIVESSFDFNFRNRFEKSISKLKLDLKLDLISNRIFEIDSNRQEIVKKLIKLDKLN